MNMASLALQWQVSEVLPELLFPGCQCRDIPGIQGILRIHLKQEVPSRCNLAVKGRDMNTASVRGMNMILACSTVVRMPDCMRDWDEVGLAWALAVEVVVVAAAAAEEVVVVEEEEEGEGEEEGEEACSRLVHKMADTFVSEDIPWA